MAAAQAPRWATCKAQEQLQLANIASAAAQLNSARRPAGQRDQLEATRQERLLATGIAGTQQTVERADAARKHLRRRHHPGRVQGLEATRRQLAVQQSQEAQLNASLKAAEAMRDLAAINLGYTRIAAPADGDGGPAPRLSLASTSASAPR